MIQWCLGRGSFFLIMMTWQHRTAFWTAATTFMCCSMSKSCASDTKAASSDKQNPLAMSCLVNLFSSAATSSCLSSSFLWVFRSWCFLAVPASSLLLTRHPGVEAKIPPNCPLYCTVQKSTREHQPVRRMHAHDNVLQTRELTAWSDMRTHICTFESLKLYSVYIVYLVYFVDYKDA